MAEAIQPDGLVLAIQLPSSCPSSFSHNAGPGGRQIHAALNSCPGAQEPKPTKGVGLARVRDGKVSKVAGHDLQELFLCRALCIWLDLA